MTRLDIASIARAVERLRDATEAEPERFAPLGLILEDWPGDRYDPDQHPQDREDR